MAASAHVHELCVRWGNTLGPLLTGAVDAQSAALLPRRGFCCGYKRLRAPPPDLEGARLRLDGALRSVHALGGLRMALPALGRLAASPAIRRQLLRPRALRMRLSPVRHPPPAPRNLPRAVVCRENLWQRRHGNMFDQELATTNKFKNTKMQPTRARALTESLGASADAHHPFRPASRVLRRAPGTRVHGDALRPRMAAILTAPTDSSGKAQNWWLTKRRKLKLIQGPEGTRPIHHWKGNELESPFIHFLET